MPETITPSLWFDAEAEDAAVPMPSVNIVRDRLITGIARGYADLDWTALALIAAEEAGIKSALSWIKGRST